MNFTLKEYFYRLYNRSLMMLLLAMGMFLAIYYLFLSKIISPWLMEEQAVKIMLTVIPIIIFVLLTIVHLSVYKRCKKIATELGLGNKLDLYFPIVKKKINLMMWASLLLAFGFFLTAHEWFSIYFGIMIVWYLLQWPSPRKVSRDMKLKGDECTMVITKGDAFEK